MGEEFEELDFADGCYWEPVLFVMHEDLFQRDDSACSLGNRLVHFAECAFT